MYRVPSGGWLGGVVLVESFLFCVGLIIILCIVMKWGYYEKLILNNKNWGRKGASLFYPLSSFILFYFILFVYIERVLGELFNLLGGGFNWKICNITAWC